jgi:hypothetical protein
MAMVIGLLGVAGCVVGFLTSPEQFYRSYLVGYLLWFGIGMGCLGLLMLNHMTGGAWGIVMRRVFEAGSRTIPLLLVLFLPVVFGMTSLYSWMDPEVMRNNALLAAKEPYLNQRFFLLRAGIYFVVWLVLMLWLNRMSRRQDESGDPALGRRLAGLSGAGTLLYVLTVTFAAFDWLMSLDPAWFSSIYGFWFAVTHGLTTFCFIVLVGRQLMTSEPLQGVITARHYDDYGKLIFAFNMLWIYVTFSQWLIIWSGNLPEEIPWYLVRRAGGYWQWSVVLFGIHFFLPFFLLLSRRLRRNPNALGGVALLLMVADWFDLYWHAMPTWNATLSLHWLDLAVLVAVGGLWVSAFFWQLQRRTILAVRDPGLKEAMGDGHA